MAIIQHFSRKRGMNPDTFGIFLAFLEGQVPLYSHYNNKKKHKYEGYLKTFISPIFTVIQTLSGKCYACIERSD